MKRFLLLSWMLVMAVPSMAHAQIAAHFKGTYEIIAPTYPQNPGRHYMLVDNDTLENIWATYADGPLPENLVPMKDDGTIILGFNDRNTLFLVLESQALVTPTYMALPGVEHKQMEMKRAADGTFDVAILEEGVITRLRTAAPVPFGTPVTPPAPSPEPVPPSDGRITLIPSR
ncbi:MAG: hypothetical protein EOP11_24465 [Proteobacteria bacterium]|nr:MAG: hypothetical protein EOP11_24465 [Pseudomonadota bacterium]